MSEHGKYTVLCVASGGQRLYGYSDDMAGVLPTLERMGWSVDDVCVCADADRAAVVVEALRARCG